MNTELRAAFVQIKPICDMVMANPTPEHIQAFSKLASGLKKESLQELQQYMLFPIITHLQSKEIAGRHELQRILVNAMKEILDRISVVSFEMCARIEMSLAKLAFDKNKPGMIADIPEELKLSAMQCMTALMLNLETPLRLKVIKTHAPLLAQAIFVSVHMAKLEKLRSLRLAALDNLLAHTCMHPKLTDANYMIQDPVLDEAVAHMLSCILPGVLATLQDVATCPNNPGHAVVTMALNATHRILCMTMNDKHLKEESTLTLADFVKVIEKKDNPTYVSKGKSDYPKLSKEWFEMAGEKLEAVVRSVVRLVTHEHYKVRRELATLCYRVLSECNITMQPSIPLCLDVLISLSADPYPQVSSYCLKARSEYFQTASSDMWFNAMDGLAKNFFMVLSSLPRVLNNIDASRKLSSLNLLVGYLEVTLSTPHTLTNLLSSNDGYNKLCDSLVTAAAIEKDLPVLNRHAARDISTPPPKTSPWVKFRHLDNEQCVDRLQKACVLLGSAECSRLLLDTMLHEFRERRDCEIVYLMNYIASAPNSDPSLSHRVIETYIEEAVWQLPVEVESGERALSEHETMDVSVYNPRAWSKDSVPGLFEGTTETRYTDISYMTPRVQSAPSGCRTLKQAQHNMVQCCLLTEGLGFMARRLQKDFEPYLLKTLCLVLERVGSRYEMLHLSGVKALNDIKVSCGHRTVPQLIAHNADYITNEITRRLKKAWNTQSALEILSVVMEYSDSTILEYMYGIVEDVLVQSCDKFYQKNLYSYLQVFHTFVSCIYKWFPHKHKPKTHTNTEINVLSDVIDYIKSEEEEDRLLRMSERDGKSVEEMYKEDQEKRENDYLDYDDTVTEEKQPIPKHVEVTITILKRCVNYIPSKDRDDAILTLQVLTLGLPVLRDYEDELLPLVHLTWGPLVERFEDEDTAVLRRALDLLVTLAMLSKDFIRHRTLKEVLPKLYKQLHKLSSESYLKDAGSYYRLSAPFHLQIATLTALAPLSTELMLPEDALKDAMDAVKIYLSNKQPKPLQTLAIQFFKTVLSYNYGATWLYLKQFCDNSNTLKPPQSKINLAVITGTPYGTSNKEYDKNVKAIFDIK